MASGASALLLAHQSDWFTTTLVALPLGFFAWLLHLARKRADASPGGVDLTPPPD